MQTTQKHTNYYLVLCMLSSQTLLDATLTAFYIFLTCDQFPNQFVLICTSVLFFPALNLGVTHKVSFATGTLTN